MAGIAALTNAIAITTSVNEEDSYENNSGLASLILFAIGTALTLLGFFGWLRISKREKLKKELMEMGEKIEISEFTIEKDTAHSGVVKNTDESVYGHRIVLNYQDKVTGITYKYKSEPLWYNPQKFIISKTIQ